MRPDRHPPPERGARTQTPQDHPARSRPARAGPPRRAPRPEGRPPPRPVELRHRGPLAANGEREPDNHADERDPVEPAVEPRPDHAEQPFTSIHPAPTYPAASQAVRLRVLVERDTRKLEREREEVELRADRAAAARSRAPGRPCGRGAARRGRRGAPAIRLSPAGRTRLKRRRAYRPPSRTRRARSAQTRRPDPFPEGAVERVLRVAPSKLAAKRGRPERARPASARPARRRRAYGARRCPVPRRGARCCRSPRARGGGRRARDSVPARSDPSSSRPRR